MDTLIIETVLCPRVEDFESLICKHWWSSLGPSIREKDIDDCVSFSHSRWGNIFMIIAVTVTLFLAFNVIVQNILSKMVEMEESTKFAIAGTLAPLVMIVLLFATSLGKEVLATFQCCRKTEEPVDQSMMTVASTLP